MIAIPLTNYHLITYNWTLVNLTPPSEPDWRVSRIRLSSQWVLLRGGAALRLVPKDASQTFGIRQVICARRVPPLVSPCGHSRWLVVRYSVWHPSTFRRSLRSTVITRFIATTDALTPGGRLFGPLGLERRLSPPGLPDYRGRTSGHSDSNHLRVGQDSPGCDRSFPSLQASSFPSRLAHSRRPNQVHGRPPLGGPLFRTGLSRSVALHPVFPRRSYRSIPHDSSPHRNGLPPFGSPAFSGALGANRQVCPTRPA